MNSSYLIESNASKPRLILRNCLFEKNTTVSLIEGHYNLNIYDSQFVQNIGTLIDQGSDSVVIDGSSFENNTGSILKTRGRGDINITDSEFLNNTDVVLRTTNATLNVSNCIFDNNKGGCIWSNASNYNAMNLPNPTMSIFESNFNNNSLFSVKGGGHKMLINKCEFTNNNSDGNGGSAVVACYYRPQTALPYFSYLTLTDSLFTRNRGESAILFEGGGGKIINSNIVSNRLVDQNNSEAAIMVKGREYHNYYNDSIEFPVSITHTNIYNNSAYHIYNKVKQDIMAINNYWGTTSEPEIYQNIWDFYDDRIRGEVIFFPFLKQPHGPPFPPPPPYLPFLFMLSQDSS